MRNTDIITGGRTMSSTTNCPCCGDPMDVGCVVCWVCYRATDRLTPGTYPDPEAPNQTFTITAEDVKRYESFRA